MQHQCYMHTGTGFTDLHCSTDSAHYLQHTVVTMTPCLRPCSGVLFVAAQTHTQNRVLDTTIRLRIHHIP